ncbi:MAG: methionyl-tRNA formyltransferase [Clostridia bacterium]|nr:methionyl-tRNA formyltransferase [Clostridia bacterium]
MNIVFMGTPDFSVPTLKALNESKHNVLGVFTQPDKAVGRKQIITPSAVKVYAKSQGLPVFQPATLRDGEALKIIKELNPDIIVVVAYGKILPEELLTLPKYGCVNGHASLLPRHRGASPIQWSIVCGDKVTGITTQLMGKGIDTGDILLSESLDIGENETGEQLHDRLSILSASVMLSTLEGLENNTIAPKKQNECDANYAPIIKREMGFIDFKKTAEQTHNLIRGFYSWPAAYFYIDNKRIKVLSSAVSNGEIAQSGTVICANKRLIVACAQNTAIELLEIQPEGSKRMSAADYLKGHPIKEGFVISNEQ